MLDDPKSDALISNFAGQWLYIRNLATVQPDPVMFADFDESLRASMQQETELFFDSIVRENRSAMDLLEANYTFLNERLAKHYGIPESTARSSAGWRSRSESRRSVGPGAVC